MRMLINRRIAAHCVTDTLLMIRDRYYLEKRGFNLPPLVLNARHLLGGSAAALRFVGSNYINVLSS